jgi:hypothetical protein
LNQITSIGEKFEPALLMLQTKQCSIIDLDRLTPSNAEEDILILSKPPLYCPIAERDADYLADAENVGKRKQTCKEYFPIETDGVLRGRT